MGYEAVPGGFEGEAVVSTRGGAALAGLCDEVLMAGKPWVRIKEVGGRTVILCPSEIVCFTLAPQSPDLLPFPAAHAVVDTDFPRLAYVTDLTT